MGHCPDSTSTNGIMKQMKRGCRECKKRDAKMSTMPMTIRTDMSRGNGKFNDKKNFYKQSILQQKVFQSSRGSSY